MCPGFARNESDHKFQTSIFQPVCHTDYKYLCPVLLSEDEVFLNLLFRFQLIECCGTARGWRLSIGMTSKSGCIQGLTHQEYTVCGTIASDAKIHVGNQKIAVRPDDIWSMPCILSCCKGMRMSQGKRQIFYVRYLSSKVKFCKCVIVTAST